MTAEQAAVWATVQTRLMQGDTKPLWKGLVKFKGYPDVEPTDAQLALMAPPRPHNKDPVHVRLRRLEGFPRIHVVASTYTMAAHGQIHPFDVLGGRPKDVIGQAALAHILTSEESYWDIATALSIPFSGLGERLLVGEQLVDEIDRLVIRIVEDE